MIKVLFFARVREALRCSSMEIDWSEELSTLDLFQEHLVVSKGEHWRDVLGEPNLVRAVNQSVVDGDYRLNDGDEVAFFPPVTGG